MRTTSTDYWNLVSPNLELSFPTESRRFPLTRLSRCPLCHNTPDLWRVIINRNGLAVPAYKVLCASRACPTNETEPECARASDEVVRAWELFCLLNRT